MFSWTGWRGRGGDFGRHKQPLNRLWHGGRQQGGPRHGSNILSTEFVPKNASLFLKYFVSDMEDAFIKVKQWSVNVRSNHVMREEIRESLRIGDNSSECWNSAMNISHIYDTVSHRNMNWTIFGRLCPDPQVEWGSASSENQHFPDEVLEGRK